MGRVSSAGYRALSAAGDLEYGGAGTPTGYVDLLAGLSGAGLGNVALSTQDGPGNWNAAWTDGNRGTHAGGPTVGVGTFCKADLTNPRRIARFRIAQERPIPPGNENNALDNPALESSDDNVNWTTRWELAVDGAANLEDYLFGDGGAGRDYGVIDLPAPITARYWRFIGHAPDPSGGNPWNIAQLELYAVTTVGAGNPTRLAAPGSRRVLTFDVGAQAPTWPAPQAANADTAGATLPQLETEVNELKASLRAAGILAP